MSLADGRCDECYARLESTAGNCTVCGWPQYITEPTRPGALTVTIYVTRSTSLNARWLYRTRTTGTVERRSGKVREDK